MRGRRERGFVSSTDPAGCSFDVDVMKVAQWQFWVRGTSAMLLEANAILRRLVTCGFVGHSFTFHNNVDIASPTSPNVFGRGASADFRRACACVPPAKMEIGSPGSSCTGPTPKYPFLVTKSF